MGFSLSSLSSLINRRVDDLFIIDYYSLLNQYCFYNIFVSDYHFGIVYDFEMCDSGFLHTFSLPFKNEFGQRRCE
jgi:hypothetical protein